MSDSRAREVLQAGVRKAERSKAAAARERTPLRDLEAKLRQLRSQTTDRRLRAGRRLPLPGFLAQKPWIVPIPSTTKLARLEENLRSAELTLAVNELQELEAAVSKIEIVGDRYPPAQQRQVEN